MMHMHTLVISLSELLWGWKREQFSYLEFLIENFEFGFEHFKLANPLTLPHWNWNFS